MLPAALNPPFHVTAYLQILGLEVDISGRLVLSVIVRPACGFQRLLLVSVPLNTSLSDFMCVCISLFGGFRAQDGG